MNSARSAILARIRHCSDKQSDVAQARLLAPSIHEQPLLKADLLTQFTEKVEKSSATWDSVSEYNTIPSAVFEFLTQHQLPLEVIIERQLTFLSWPEVMTVAYRRPQSQDSTSVNIAFAGIAETGSLVMRSQPSSPTTLNFLPENHIVLLEKSNIVAHIEAIWPRIRLQALPRTINIITGPSRTADIEQTLQLGAHGPKRVHVILVDTPLG
ncbi:MAG: lactate utilization protein [Pseudomonadota bacterium]|nr:lactate utilization protein [Pseudomonadota bacterium]